MRIGYQGVEGSNAEQAAKNMAARLGYTDPIYVPLISSKQVVGELKRGNIDYAVVAVKNTLGGTVSETFTAIKNEFLELVATEVLPIHHCLFAMPGVAPAEVMCIASHEQALKQTSEHRQLLFPQARELAVEDTAIAARYLSQGQYAEGTAVLCRQNAGELYGLNLLASNIEDSSSNFTEFRMFQRPTIDHSNTQPPTMWERVKYQLVNEQGLGYISKALMVLSLFLAFYVSNFFSMSAWDTSVTVGGYLSIVFLFLTSSKLRSHCRYQSLVGYWKYYSLSDNQAADLVEQKFDTPRIVKIEEIDGELCFRGFICDRENVPLFESTKVLVSAMGKQSGQLVYWYRSPEEMHREYTIGGLVELNWTASHPAASINRMSGYYMGEATRDRGAIEYLRITKEEFEVHRTSDFL